jgi:C_GCAxxG_C_C family probable redox protein
VNVASAFCGGVGRSHEDVCGAFTGGVIATGFLYGRKEKGKDLSKACAVVSRFREQFIEAFGSTNCELILKKLGDQEKFIKCKKLTAKATGMLADIIILAEREKL